MALILIVSLYIIIQGSLNYSSESLERSPEFNFNELINSLDINGVLSDRVRNNDFRGIETLLSHTASPSIIMYFEGVYYIDLIVSGVNTEQKVNVSFSYLFPQNVDENSIRISDNNVYLKSNVKFVYYKKPLLISISNGNKYGRIQDVMFTIPSGKISNNTLSLYMNGNKQNIDLEVWTQINDTQARATITTYFPQKMNNETINIYYGTNESLFNETYYDFTFDQNADYTELNYEKSQKADIAFEAKNIDAGKTKNLILTYSLFTNEFNNYIQISNISNQDAIAKTKFDEEKQITSPLYSTYKGKWLIEKSINTKEGVALLKIYLNFI